MERSSIVDPGEVHLIIAISFSMIITFGFHSAMKDIPGRASFSEHVFLDIVSDIFLFCRCLVYDWKGKIFIRYRFDGNQFH